MVFHKAPFEHNGEWILGEKRSQERGGYGLNVGIPSVMLSGGRAV